MKKKVLAVVAAAAALALSACVLAGCSSSSSSSSASASASASASGSASAATKFVVGFDAEYPPYGYMGDDGKPVGFDLDLATEVATRNGWAIELQAIDWDAKDALIESGAIGFVGGVAGSVLGLGVGFVLNHLGDIMGLLGQSVDLSGLMGGGYYYMGMDSGTISLIPPWLILAALAFATCIGLLSGVAPANRAVKISALEAIRHD